MLTAQVLLLDADIPSSHCRALRHGKTTEKGSSIMLKVDTEIRLTIFSFAIVAVVLMLL